MVDQAGWTKILTPHGRYEYQFQGSGPSVRNGQYEDAKDYQFLVMDEEGWLYRIPVRVSPEVEKEVAAPGEVVALAAAQLRAGLATFRPRQNAPFTELDQHFALDVARAQALRQQE